MLSDKEKIRVLFTAEKKMEQGKYKEAYELVEDFQPDLVGAWSQTEQGIFYWIIATHEQNIQEALSLFTKSINLLRSSPDKSPLIRSMISMSKSLSHTGEDVEALYLLKEAYEIAMYENIATFSKITLLFQLGVCHGKLGEVYSSIYFFNQAHQRSDELDIQYKSGKIYMSLGICYMQLNQFTQSKESLEKALLSFQLTKDTENLAGTYLNLGILYGYHHIYDEATDHLRTAIELYQQLGKTEVRLQCMMKLVSFLYEDGDWEEATSYCKGVLLEKNGTYPAHVSAFELLSDMERNKYQLDQAIKFINEALSLLDETSSQKKRLLTKKAQIYRQKGEWEKAVELYDQL